MNDLEETPVATVTLSEYYLSVIFDTGLVFLLILTYPLWSSIIAIGLAALIAE